ncbi:hypothetical protein BGW80DRAFT_1252678 [Lactifluus volemus]|nr:hypothetical protein BGW80DRAFT_1252678 [Lactifluus volemus]
MACIAFFAFFTFALTSGRNVPGDLTRAADVELLAAVQLANKVELSAAVELERHAPVLLVQFTLVEFANKVALAASIELLEDNNVELERHAVLLAQIALVEFNVVLLAKSAELLDDANVELERHAVPLAQIALVEFNVVPLAKSAELLDDANVELERHAPVLLLAQIALEFPCKVLLATSEELLEDNSAVELERHAAVALVQFTLVEFANKVVLAATNTTVVWNCGAPSLHLCDKLPERGVHLLQSNRDILRSCVALSVRLNQMGVMFFPGGQRSYQRCGQYASGRTPRARMRTCSNNREPCHDKEIQREEFCRHDQQCNGPDEEI